MSIKERKEKELEIIINKIKETISKEEMTLQEALKSNGYNFRTNSASILKIKAKLNLDPDVLTSGYKRGTLYYTKETPPFLTTEQKAEKLYDVLSKSPTQLHWKDMWELAELDGNAYSRHASALKTHLRKHYFDIILGDVRGTWAIDGVHDVIDYKTRAYNYRKSKETTKKEKYNWAFCPHCGEKL